MNIKFLLISFLIFTELLQAQTKLLTGYVIRQNGDTVCGRIEFKNDIDISTLCRFHPNGDSLSIYSPTAIRVFQFINGDRYESKQVCGTSFFLEKIGNKTPVIYYKHDLKGFHYYITNLKDQLTEIPYYVYSFNQKGKLVTIHSNLNYHLFKLFEKVDSTFMGLKTYRKTFNIEFLGARIYNENIIWKEGIMLAGTMVDIYNPRGNGNFSFRTGIQFINMFNKCVINTHRIPFQFQYQTNSEIINARIAAGFNLYYSSLVSMAFMGGLDVRLTKTVSWTITYDVDYDHISSPLDAPLSNSISTGFIVGI